MLWEISSEMSVFWAMLLGFKVLSRLMKTTVRHTILYKMDVPVCRCHCLSSASALP